MEREITKEQPLLDRQGRIIEEGWARQPLWRYERKAVKGGPLRIKEWEYWAIVNQAQGYALTATVSDLGYAALLALSYTDLKRREVAQTDAIAIMPLGKMGLAPSSSEESQVSWSNKELRIALFNKKDHVHLMVGCPSLVLPDGTVGLDFDVTFTRPSDAESLNIATSWEEQRKAFYLNEKANCYSVAGTVRRGMKEEQLLLGEAWAVLDWGRGRWTYQNTWYWASLSTVVENTVVGLNLGYGFSDRTPASENAIIYNHRIHKIGKIRFDYQPDDLMHKWIITDEDGRLDLVFEPWVDRSSKFNLLVIKSVQHQLFGAFSGTLILDDGSTVTLDGAIGFAEKVFNRW
jgi:hypothetical protein